MKNIVIKNSLKNQKSLGCWMPFTSVQLIELLAIAGFDFVQLDGEHGPFDLDQIETTCITAELCGMSVFARPQSCDTATINMYLERGVQGIVAPHVDTVQQAINLVRSCRFGPEGERSWGSGRSLLFNDPISVEDKDGLRTSIITEANSQMIVTAQLETQAALDNLDDMLEIEGIDYFTFGPNDLAQSMGVPGEPKHDTVVCAIRDATNRIHEKGKKIVEDEQILTTLPGLILDSARTFVSNNSSKRG
jgi:4-hydroxy-2-oxoheptanedioate aldolase